MMGKQNYDIDHEGEDDREKNARIKCDSLKGRLDIILTILSFLSKLQLLLTL